MRMNENEFGNGSVLRHKAVDRKREVKRVLTGMKPSNGCPCDITRIGKAAAVSHQDSSHGQNTKSSKLYCRCAHLFMPHAIPQPTASAVLSILVAVFAPRRGS
jgi:hypothetical protein